MSTEERMFPIQEDAPPWPRKRGWITWAEAESVYADYAYLYGTSQSLERLAQRGGFGRAEIDVIRKEAAEERRRRQVSR